MNTNFEMAYLSGGDDVFGPNLGGATVYTNVRAGYAAECPNAGKFVSNLKFSLPMENQIMDAILKRRGSQGGGERMAQGQSGRGQSRGSRA